MSKYHFNHNYDGGSPNLPLGIGDRYYGQDLGLDFNCLFEKAGLTLKDIVESIPIIVSGLVATKGTGNTLNITAGRGYAEWDITIPTTPWAVPPSTTTQTFEAVRIVATAQTNMTCPSAVLDDVTVNYIKLRFKENNNDTRTRAKKSGTYAYRLEESFEFTVSPTAPTSKDIVLGSFISVGNNIPPTIEITNRSPEFTNDTFYAGNVFNTDVAVENININEPVGLFMEGYRKSKYEITELLMDSDTEGTAFAGVCKLENNHYAVFFTEDSTPTIIGTCKIYQYTNGVLTNITSSQFVNNASAGGSTPGYNFPCSYLGNNVFLVTYFKGAGDIYGRVGSFNGSTITWFTEFLIQATYGSNLWDLEQLYDNNFAIVYMRSATPTYTTKVGQINISTGAVTWIPAVPLDIPAGAGYPRICPLENGYYVITYSKGTTPIVYGILYNFNGSTLTLMVSEKELAEQEGSTIPAYLPEGFWAIHVGGNVFAVFIDDYGSGRHFIYSLCTYSSTTLESIVQEKWVNNENFSAGLTPMKPIKIGDNKIALIKYISNDYGVTSNTFGQYLYIFTISNYSIKIERKKLTITSAGGFPVYLAMFNDNLLACVTFDAPAAYLAYTFAIKIPKYSGIATETKSAGQNIIVQHKGIKTGLTGLLKGMKYFVNTKDGILSLGTEFNYDDFLAGEALSDTKLLLK